MKLVGHTIYHVIFRIGLPWCTNWQFKQRNMEKDDEGDHLSLRCFHFRYGKEWYCFQQELMVSKLDSHIISFIIIDSMRLACECAT